MKNIYSTIKKAKKYLINNDIIAIPTETVYGLAGNAYSNESVKKIFIIKKRPLFNPLIVHYVRINDLKNSINKYQKLIQLNSFVENKFKEKAKSITSKTSEILKKIQKK